MHEQLLTPRTRSGVESIEHVVRRFRWREVLDLAAADTAGVIELPPVDPGFLVIVDQLNLYSSPASGNLAATAFVNSVSPENVVVGLWDAHVYAYAQGTIGQYLAQGDRLVVDVTAATAGAQVGVMASCRLLQVEPRAWPQAAPVSVVELRPAGPELAELEEAGEG